MLPSTDSLPDLFLELERLIAQIPPGRVVTCGALAEALGDRQAARWIGHFLLHHDHRPDCPCHRVVRAGGALGQYVAGSAGVKRALLEAEGVAVEADRVDLEHVGFATLTSTRPLRLLRQEQQALAGRVVLQSWNELPECIGGIDVSYASSGEAVAAYALVAVASGELVWSTTVRCAVTFPYIPTYLTYRELPALLQAVSAARAAGQLAELALVDGAGILHPRRLGIAAHLGVVAGIATVGVAKSLLCGRVAGEVEIGSPAPILLEDVLTGVAVMPVANRKHTLYVSPGQGVDVATAERAVAAMLRGRRLPEPIYWADRLSRAAAREPTTQPRH